MNVTYPYKANDQIERYIAQFMRVFSGFQTMDGVERNGGRFIEKIPVVYGGMSRVIAARLTKADPLANPRVPVLAANVVSITKDPELNKNPRHEDVRTVVRDGVRQAMERLSGPAYVMSMSLGIYASSQTQLFDILSQILMIFNPRIVIQKTSDITDWNYITEVTLTSIDKDIQYPLGMDSQICMMELSFEFPFRLNYPMGFNDKIIEEIRLKVLTGVDSIVEELPEVVITGENTP